MTHRRRTLTLDQCAAVTAESFQPSDGDQFGLECEWPTYDLSSPSSRTAYEVLSSIAARPLPSRSVVSIEPGGQIELSTLADHNLSRAIRAAETDEAHLTRALTDVGVTVGDTPVDTFRLPEMIRHTGRYRAMGEYWDAADGIGRWMMCNTSSVQINVSNDAADATRRWMVSNLIGPLLVAVFANSGGTDRTGSRWESLRQGVWSAMEKGHSRAVPMSADPARSWLEHALAADVFYVQTDDPSEGVALPPGLPFGVWMERGADFGWPRLDDFRYHLTTLFPPVRPKGWLEFRMLDALPSAWRTAAAVTVAVATCTSAGAELLESLPAGPGWTAAARLGLRDPGLRASASVLTSAVLRHVDELDIEAEHADALMEFVARYTVRGQSPSFQNEFRLPVALDHCLPRVDTRHNGTARASSSALPVSAS